MDDLIPIVGDKIKFLNCYHTCGDSKNCKVKYQEGQRSRDIISHIAEGTVIQCTSSDFSIREENGVWSNKAIVEIRREIIQPPEDIINIW